MQATVEDAGPCKKKISFEIGVETIEKKLDEKYTEFMNTMSVPGFRKGHLPRGLAQKRFGKEIRGEVQEALMSEALQEAIEENQLEPLGTPKFDNISFEEDKPLTYDVSMSVKPTFELKEYKGLKATRPSTDVLPAEVDEQVEQIRKGHAQAVPVEGEPVEADHHLLTKFAIRVDGEELIGRESAYLVLSEDHLFGIPCEKLADHFVGKKVDDTVEVPVTLPETYPKEEYRGKAATVACTILDIKRLELPEADDAFAETLDHDTMDDLREAIEEHLIKRKVIDADQTVEEALIEQILEANDFDLPEDIIEHELHHTLERQRQALESQELEPEEIEKKLDIVRTEQREEQVKRMKGFFILDKIAKGEKLFATEEEVEQRIATLAAGRGVSPAQLRAQIEEADDIGQLRSQIREEKTRAFLREKATLTDEAAPAAKPKKAEPQKAAKAKKPAGPKKTAKKKKEDSADKATDG